MLIVKIYNRYVVILARFYTQDPLRFGRRNVRRGEMERDKVRERREFRRFQVVTLYRFATLLYRN